MDDVRVDLSLCPAGDVLYPRDDDQRLNPLGRHAGRFEFLEALAHELEASVYIVQESCHQVCVSAGIYQTQAEQVVVGKDIDVEQLIKSVVDEQSGRYNSFLTQFADGFQDTELQMYRWLLYPVIVADLDMLEAGLRLGQLRRMIAEKHFRGNDLNPGNVTQALQSTASLQVKKDIKPIILDYDQTNVRLNVVDKSFLIWLRFQDRSELLELVSLPTISDSERKLLK